MKNTRLALAVLLTSLTATSALAASVTMLQFGSFETRDEAEKRLAEIKAKHGAQVGSLATSIREVKLPPDNLTVYRTQAGPVADRAAAQGICSKLAAGGDECYIVQTAMMAPAAAAPVAAAASAKAPAIAEKDPDVAPSAAAKDPVSTNLGLETTPAPNLTRNLTTLTNVPPRDPSSRSMLAGINAAPKAATPSTSPVHAAEPTSEAVAADTPEIKAAEPSPEMIAALDKAAAEQQANIDKVNDAVVNANDKRPSRNFWSRMNPFSEDEVPAKPTPSVAAPVAVPVDPVIEAANPPAVPPAQAPAPAVSEPVAIAPMPEPAPVAEAESAPMKQSEPVMASAPVQPIAPLPVPAPEQAPAPVVQAQPATPIVIPTPTAAPDQPPAMRLPPPPEPLRASDRDMLIAAPTAKPAPIATGDIARPSDVAGNVKVEEAQRVPVTNTAVPALQPLPSTQSGIVSKPLPPQTTPAASQVPSATDGQKTLWAQVGPFVNGNAALGFWTNYRQSHPDFPVVRVRVAAPYQQKLRGSKEAWLRVGPMARLDSIGNLCASLPKDSKLQCGHITDLGVTVSAEEAQRKVDKIIPKRYKRKR